ncbi:MAG: tripartite tricarboxylate transporter substrate binding protein [Proteobacteria bacterium]|nr:tripartite tricarboxylate transporter substrate binding protein [Burkholderiales bacterium]
MRFSRTLLCALACAGGLAAAAGARAQAQTQTQALPPGWPAKPIRLVVPQSAGGSTDLVARPLAQFLSAALNQNVLVDNRPGAGSVVGSEIVARSAPDGYTLLAVASSFSATPALQPKLSFDSERDFAPISMVSLLPGLLVVHPSLPVKSVQELIALAKSKPGRLNYSSSGLATGTHMSMELFQHLTGIQMVHVPYKGGAPSVQALISNEVQVTMATMSTALPHVRSGRLRALGVTTAKRSSAIPEVAPIAESGVPGFDHSSWVGLLAPAKTPAPVIARLNAEVVKVATSVEMKALLAAEGSEPVGSSSAEFATLIRTEVARWKKVVKSAGIRIE